MFPLEQGLSALNSSGPEFMEDPQQKQAWMSSLRILAATPKSSKELARKLTEKGYPAQVVRETLQKLQDQGVLNDRSYASNLLEQFSRIKPSGNRRIDFEMKRRGVPQQIREELMSSLDPESEHERARELGTDRWNRFKNLDTEKRKKKVYDFLIRRGFDFQIARDLMQELETQDEHDENR